jgi:hypothetical protein
VHLAAGYLANLAFAVAFLAAIAALARETREGAIGAAWLLGAGALAHPQFFALGALILAIAAAPSLAGELRERPRGGAEAVRVGGAVLGGAVLLAACSASMQVGPQPLGVATSKDAILRSLGRGGELRSAYWGRFLDRAARYVQWISIPLAIFGLPAARGFVGRVLRSWGVATVVGVAVAIATAWFPADRFVTFGYVVPILAALGLVRVARRVRARRGSLLAAVVAVALAAGMLLGAALAWRRQESFIAPNEVRTVTAAGRYLSAAGDATTALFAVGDLDRGGLFELARAGNVIRAAVPPDRIRTAVPIPVLTGPAAESVGARALETLHARALALARRSSGGSILNVALRPFAPAYDYEDPRARVAPGVLVAAASSQSPEPESGEGAPARPTPVAVAADPLASSSAPQIVLASLASLAVLTAVGYGWSRAAVGRGMADVALAPAFGLAAITLFGILVDRLGVRLGGAAAPTAAVALAAACGYLSWYILQRRPSAQPPAKVGEQPEQ